MTRMHSTGVRSVGDNHTITATLTDSSGNPSTDATVRFLVETPAGAVSVSTAAGTTSGTYSVTFQTTAAGRYEWRMESTGTVIASTSGRVAVRSQIVSTG